MIFNWHGLGDTAENMNQMLSGYVNTAGFHFKQLLVNGKVIWEEDVAGGSNAWREVTVDVGPAVQGTTNLSLAFRLFDKKGVSNFGVRWQWFHHRSQHLPAPA